MSRASNPKPADQFRAIPLESVLRALGARLDPYDRRKWHAAHSVVSIQGAKFFNWNRGRGGGGAIDLVMHLNDLSFLQALQWLQAHFPLPLSTFEPPPSPPLALRLPFHDSRQLQGVRDYLIHQRAIPQALVDTLLHSGALYADHRANAVFLLLGKENIPLGAELRGTAPHPWHGMAPGSRKDSGFFSAPTSRLPLKGVILCESAIDAISCSVIHPQLRCLSTAGARPNPAWLVDIIQTVPTVYCGFDADPTGDAMARAMIAQHPRVQRLRPARHDWNDLLRSSS